MEDPRQLLPAETVGETVRAVLYQQLLGDELLIVFETGKFLYMKAIHDVFLEATILEASKEFSPRDSSFRLKDLEAAGVITRLDYMKALEDAAREEEEGDLWERQEYERLKVKFGGVPPTPVCEGKPGPA